ncbi:MAG: hypothetical protein U9P14_09640 [Gemmatimonadota bacterium]|nr:hypothetical protein [Gemmatimonadota bacterium]
MRFKYPGALSFGNAIRISLGTVLLVSWSSVLAQSKYAGESFSVGVGARGLGMGSAYHTLATGAEALYWNPAGLARTEGGGGAKNHLAFMHSERFRGEVDYNFIGYARRTSGSGRHAPTVGLGLIHLGVGGIPVTRLEDPDRPLGPDNRPVISRYSSKNDFLLIAGLGRKLSGDLCLGANVKVLHVSQEGASGNGFGFDLGAIMPVTLAGIPLLASLSARDVTTSFLAYSTGKREYIKPWVSGGLATAEGFKVPGGRIAGAFEVSVPMERRRKNYRTGTEYLLSLLHLGIEYSIGSRMFLRGGVDEKHPTFGAGIFVRSLAVDYAWIGHRDLDQTHRVSLGYFF